MPRPTLAVAALAAALLVPSSLPAQEPAAPSPAERRLAARVDPRVELLAIVFRLAGNPEYSQGQVPSYAEAVDARFGKFRGHAVVRHAAALRRYRGVSFDAVMSLAVHLDDDFRLSMPLGKAVRLDGRWPAAETGAFVDELRDFASAAGAREFFRAQAPLYDLAAARLQKVLDEQVRLSWFDRFFGARPGARFEIAAGLLNGHGNFGPSVLREGGREDLHCVLGAWTTDAEGRPTFGPDAVPIVVHEFCHSYCNPLVEAHAGELQAAALRLWPHVADAMGAQGYRDWKTMMSESLVRAGVVRYRSSCEGPEAAGLEIREQIGNSFLWTGELADRLAAYEGERDAHPTLDSFMPGIARFLAEYATRFEAEMARTPKVESMQPADGARDVDPSLTSLVVRFDRPMRDGAWSVVGGGPRMPTITGKPSYDATTRILTIPVELQPGRSYEFWLNRGKFDSFASAEGVMLRSVHVAFETRAK